MKKYKSSDSSEDIRVINLLDYLYVILRWRRIVMAIVGSTFIVSLILMYLILPRWYKSTAVILPPKQKTQFSTSSLLRSFVPLGGLGIGRASDDLYNYMAILKSRNCRTQIIQKFDLINRYGTSNIEDALIELDDNTTIETTRDDVALEISVFDTDSAIAAQITNSYVDVLNKISLKLATREAQSNREFLQKRYEQNLKDLKASEETLKDFQQKSSVYSLPEQLKAAIQAAAEIKTQALVKEIEIGVYEKSVTSDDSRLQQLKIELAELNKKLKQMKYGDDKWNSGSNIIPSFDEAPGIGLQYARLFREVEIQQRLLEILLPLFEQAKIEEQRDTPTLLVLDQGVPAVKPSKPRRLLTTFFATFASFFVAVFLVFIFDYYRRTRDEIERSDDVKLQFIRSELRWKKLFSWKSHDSSKEI